MNRRLTEFHGVPFEADTRTFSVIATMNLSKDELKDEATFALENGEMDETDYQRCLTIIEQKP